MKATYIKPEILRVEAVSRADFMILGLSNTGLVNDTVMESEGYHDIDEELWEDEEDTDEYPE